MSLPHARHITVDDQRYEWICKKDRRASSYEEDDYGDEVPVYDKVITIRADKEKGKLIQHRVDQSAITPKLVAELIRANVIEGNL